MSSSTSVKGRKERYYAERKASTDIPAHLLSTHRCAVDGKASYRSRREALRALRNITGRSADCTARDVYLGPECGEWHLTSARRGQ